MKLSTSLKQYSQLIFKELDLTITYADLSYPDCVCAEIRMKRAPTEDEWRVVHKYLQQRYSANFPAKMRHHMLGTSYRLIGVRTPKKRRAKK